MERLKPIDEYTKLGVEITDDGREIVKGIVKGQKFWAQRETLKNGDKKYTAQVGDYKLIDGNNAIALFDKYYDLTKFKTRL